MQQMRKKNGTYTYREKVYINGRVVTKTFSRKSDAIAWKQRKTAERDRNQALGISFNDDILLSDYCKTWVLNKKTDVERRTVDQYNSLLKVHILPCFGKYKLREIKVTQGHTFKQILAQKGLQEARIHLAIMFLKQLFNDAVKWEYLPYSPFRNLNNIKVPEKPIVYWLPAEIKRFLNANTTHQYYELYLVAINTGMRLGELCGLCWDKVDFKTSQIEISRVRDRYGLKETTKTGKIRHMNMCDSVITTLQKLNTNKKNLQYVFCDKDGNPARYEHSSRYFNQAVEQAGVKKIQFKHLRSTYASNFCMKEGGDIFELSTKLGHTSVLMTQKKYAHLHRSHMKKTANIVNFAADSTNIARENFKLVENE